MTTRRILFVLLGLVLAGGVAGATFAYWNASATLPGAVVVGGNLDIELDGAATWQQVEPEPAAIASVDGVTAAHLATPGDVLTLTQQFRTSLVGNNLAARLTVDWADPASLDGVEASYVITPPHGAAQNAETFGTALTFPEAPANLTPDLLASWGSDPWTLTVTLRYTGSDVVVAPSEISAPRFTDLGTVSLSLDQVRDGDGFDE